jgi:two-component system, NtrC family, response regulator AtoC
MPSNDHLRFALTDTRWKLPNCLQEFSPLGKFLFIRYADKGATQGVTEDKLGTTRVLVVSQDPALQRARWSLRESSSWHVETAKNCWEAMDRVHSDEDLHLILLDVTRGEGNDVHVIRWLRKLRPELPVILTWDSEDGNAKDDALRMSAEAVLVRPFETSELEAVMVRVLDARARRAELAISSEDIEAVGDNDIFLSVSPVMQKVRAQAELLAQSDVPVLIVGEPGSGKATVARLIHKLSLHSANRFHRINCAAMPPEMLEAELFGRNSTLNSVLGPKQGKLHSAEPGTLLLEAISKLPPSIQSRLLQVLEEKQIGGSHRARIRIGLRILATSSVVLDPAATEKRFNKELYRRLSAFTIHVPSLRRRKDEIEALLRYSMYKLSKQYGMPSKEFSQQTLDACINYSWPGNLHEMEAFVKRHLVTEEEELNFHAPELARNYSPTTARCNEEVKAKDEQQHIASDISLKSLIQGIKSDAERTAIAAALKQTHWNRKAAARLLRVSYRTLLYKIERYHIDRGTPFDGDLRVEGL